MDNTDGQSTFFGRCKCCLNYDCVMNIWMQYEFEGVTEIYAELMKETFSINWLPGETFEEFICNMCVTRLREAHEFKTVVLSAEKKLHHELKDIESGEIQFMDENNIKLEIKNEEVEPKLQTNTEFLEVEYLDEVKEELHNDNGEHETVELAGGEYYVLNDDGNSENVIFEVVVDGDDHNTETALPRKRRRQITAEDGSRKAKNCLEDLWENEITVAKVRSKPQSKTIDRLVKNNQIDSDTNDTIIINNSNIEYDEACDTNDSETMNTYNEGYMEESTKIDEQYIEIDRDNDTADSSEGVVTKRKWPRKKRKHEITRFYKNYSIDDMRNCLEAIRKGNMSVSEAAKQYGIPRKTVSAKVREGFLMLLEKPADEQKFLNEEKNHNFVRELKTVLSLTNIVPFKVKSSKFVCAYCFTMKDNFDDPDDLRIHTMTHEKEWIKHVNIMMRPHSQNETIRVDTDALQCTACNLPLAWKDFYSHLEEYHEVHLEECLNKLIPFKLNLNNSCTLCSKRFQNFALLDAHMNTHYRNYMCSECGDTFLSETRLKQHLQIHNKGRYPCPECGKIFPLDKYMKKHMVIVHKKMKAFKCMHCTERFRSELERHSHVSQQHSEKVRILTCELCGKSFDWRPYYLAHLRKVHSGVKNNKCRFCSKAFSTKYEVKTHEQRHTGTGEHYCNECGKNFVTLMELRSHSRRHRKESNDIES